MLARSPTTPSAAALPLSARLVYPSLSLFTFGLLSLAIPVNDINIFLLHPLSMLAFAWLAIMAIRTLQIPEGNNRRAAVDLHACLQGLATLASWIGTIVIYYVKESKGRPHATSWHGLFGYLVVFSFALNGVGGYALRSNGKKWFGKSGTKVWVVHRWMGILFVAVGVLGAVGLALWSNYMRRSISLATEGSEKTFGSTQYGVLGLLVTLLAATAAGLLQLAR